MKPGLNFAPNCKEKLSHQTRPRAFFVKLRGQKNKSARAIQEGMFLEKEKYKFIS
jgi:hypothetical protein